VEVHQRISKRYHELAKHLEPLAQKEIEMVGGVNPPPGVPNLFNTVWTLTINNQNSGILTLTGVNGVTITGVNTIAATSARVFIVTVTSPTTVAIQSVYAGAVTL